MLGSASLKLGRARFRWGWTLKLCSINKWSGLGLSGRKSKAQSCPARAEYILPLVTCTFTKEKYEKKNEKVIAKSGPTQHRPTQLTKCADKDLERYSSGQALPGPLKVGLGLGIPRTLPARGRSKNSHVSASAYPRQQLSNGTCKLLWRAGEESRSPASELLPPPSFQKKKRLKIKT